MEISTNQVDNKELSDKLAAQISSLKAKIAGVNATLASLQSLKQQTTMQLELFKTMDQNETQLEFTPLLDFGTSPVQTEMPL